MHTNRYLKICPECKKDFRARRLNQVYCTSFCKSQFNNAKAKARRLELAEIEKKYHAQQTEHLPKQAEPKTTPPPEVKPKEKEVKDSKSILPSFNFKKLGIAVALALVAYLLYKYFFQEKPKVLPPQLFAKNQVSQDAPPQNPSQIPTEIYHIKPEGLPEKIPLEIKSDDQNQTQKPPAIHPDVSAHEKILRNQNRI